MFRMRETCADDSMIYSKYCFRRTNFPCFVSVKTPGFRLLLLECDQVTRETSGFIPSILHMCGDSEA